MAQVSSYVLQASGDKSCDGIRGGEGHRNRTFVRTQHSCGLRMLFDILDVVNEDRYFGKEWIVIGEPVGLL